MLRLVKWSGAEVGCCMVDMMWEWEGRWERRGSEREVVGEVGGEVI